MDVNNNTTRKNFKGILPHDYEHKGERVLQNTLDSNATVKKIFSLVSEYGIERGYTLRYTGGCIQVKETNLPELHHILMDVCKILDISKVPRMYVEQDPFINAFATGIDNPIIVVTTGALDKLSVEELYFIIGHEAGHVKSKHIRYNFLHLILPSLGAMIPLIGSLASVTIDVLLYRFSRLAEYTADRAGLLCCQNLDVATEALMKLAGYPEQYYDSINKEEFIRQFYDLKDYNEDNYNKILTALFHLNMTHPWSVFRGKELYEWVNDKSYEDIITKFSYTKSISSHHTIVCKSCGKERIMGDYCPYCGAHDI